MPKKPANMAEYLLPLYINGLSGRMLRIPPPKNKKREILFIYGHHTSLERVFGAAEMLNRFGGVTIPDLPGFGGMEPFYKIGEKPTLDNMADYLAAFVKLRYRNRRFTIAGASLGFIIVTRMLQKYPEIAKKVDLVVSIAGFTNKNDFIFKRRNFIILRTMAWIFSNRLPAAFAKYVIFRAHFIRMGYKIGETISFNAKLATINEKDREERIKFEIYLWQSNDIRTYCDMTLTMFSLNLSGRYVQLPVHHVAIADDHYFDNVKVEQHMRTIYSDFISYVAKAPSHSPSVVATAEEASLFVPPALEKLLRKRP
jgi:pimeloyl-ACP methyl ester carboxylesterase